MTVGANTVAQMAVHVGANLDEFNKKMNQAEGRMHTMASRLGNVGKNLTFGVTLPLLGIGAAATKIGIDFDKAMFGVNSVMKLSGQQFADLENQVLDFSTTTSQSSTEVAHALRLIAARGYNAADSMKVLRIAVDEAGNMMSDTATTTQALTGILQAYNLTADHTRQVADVMEAAVNHSGMSFDTLSASIGNVTGVAAQAGVGFKTVMAAMMAMRQKGYDVYQGVTSIRAAILSFLRPSADMTKAVKALGYQSAYAMLKEVGFAQSMRLLTEHVHGSADAMAAFFPNVRALKAALALSGGEAKNFAADLKVLDNASAGVGEHERMRAIRHQSAAYQLSKLRSETEVFANRLAAVMRPTLVKVVKQLTKWVTVLANLNPKAQKLIVITAGVAAAIGPLMMGVSLLNKALLAMKAGAILTSGAFTSLASSVLLPLAPVLAVVAAGALLYRAWTTDFGGIQEKTYSVLDAVRRGVSSAGGWLVNAFGTVARSVLSIGSTLFNTLNRLTGGKLGEFVGMWKSGLSYLYKVGKQVFTNFPNIVAQAMRSVVTSVGHGLAGAARSLASFARHIPGLGNMIADQINAGADKLDALTERLASALNVDVTANLGKSALQIGGWANDIAGTVVDAAGKAHKALDDLIAKAKAALGFSPRSFAGHEHDLNKFIHDTQQAGMNAKDLNDILGEVDAGLADAGDKAKGATPKVDEMTAALRRTNIALKVLDWRFAHKLIDKTTLLASKVSALQGLLDTELAHGMNKMAEKTADRIKALKKQLTDLQEMKAVLPSISAPSAGLESLVTFTDAFTKALQGLRKSVASGADVGAVTGKIGGFLSQVDALIAAVAEHSVTADTLRTVRLYSVAVGAVSSTITGAVDALKALAEYVPAPGAGMVTARLVRFTRVVAEQMADAADTASALALAKAKMFATATGSVFSVLNQAVESLKAIRSGDWGLPRAADYTHKLVRFAKELALQMAAAYNLVTPEEQKQAVDFAAHVTGLFSVLNGAVESLKAIRPADWNLPHAADYTYKLVRFAKELALQMAAQGAVLGDETEKAARGFADAVGGIFSVLTDAVGALKAIRPADWNLPHAADYTEKLVKFAKVLAYQMAQAADAIGGDTMTAAGRFAGAASKVLGPVKDSIAALKAIGAYTAIKDLGPHINAFQADLVGATYVLAMAFRTGAEAIDRKVGAEAGRFADLASKVLAPAKSGIDALKAIGAYTAIKDLGPHINAFQADLVGATYVLATAFRTGADSLGSHATDAAGRFADTISKVLAPVKGGIDALKAIGAYTAVALGGHLESFQADLMAVSESLATAFSQVSLTEKAQTAASKWASTVGAVLAPVKAGVDAIGSIAAYLRPANLTAQVSAFSADLVAVADTLAAAFAAAGAQMGDKAQKAAKDYAATAGAVMAPVQSAVGVFKTITNYTGWLNKAKIGAFTTDLLAVTDQLSAGFAASAARLGGETLSRAKLYAATVRDVVGAVGEGLKVLKWLKWYSHTNLTGALEAFTGDMEEVLQAMADTLVPEGHDLGYDIGQAMHAGIREGLNSGQGISLTAPGGEASGSGITLVVYGDVYVGGEQPITAQSVLAALGG